ncbi:ubiquinone biosynthesis protein coq-8 [Periconia macrospinosa]|uniref:Ubiquinone biosynthesis protein coq-8 n=1 Tax=Periconia macrospinosa TaxID=97972 RepID=A0A2V1DZZ3_9PLEO|nr:ubiquinone biosynthesis protein coq-8 [Periconia macrospinosa]
MAGRRLIDAAKLFNASKSIAQQHIKLRSQQWDVYSKTSSLAKAAKSQTDRVTLTLEAALALSKRLNEEAPKYASAAAQRATAGYDTSPAATPTTAGPPQGREEGLEQDHHYGRSDRETRAQPPAQGELDVHQEDAKRSPLPDGTIPSEGVTLDNGAQGQDTFSKRPVAEPPKHPLAKDDTIGVGEGLKPVESTTSTIPLPNHPSGLSADRLRDSELDSQVASVRNENIPDHVAVPEANNIPEGINTDVFHSPRVAKILGGNPYKHTSHMDLKGAARTPFDHTEIAKGHDQDTFNVRTSEQTKPSIPEEPPRSSPPKQATQPATTEQEMHDFASELAKDANIAASPISDVSGEINTAPAAAQYELRESRVPSSRFGRLWQYAGLGTSMAFGAVGESLRRVTGSAAASGGSLMLSPANIEILVAKLSRMRGAALKLGQMISIQDIKMLPPAIHDVLRRVQDSADYMPASQRNQVLSSNLGPNWRDLFDSFEDVPIAAASIGQVHRAVLKSTKETVAVKVQYPGVANSIDSDLNNLSILLTASRLLPKGLFLDKTIANARTELGWECDYLREAEWQTRFREALADDTDAFVVPKVFPEASGREVLTAEFVTGTGVAKLPSLSQEKRDWIGTQILRLSLREIVEFKFMQTDPNWTNFLYNEKDHKIELLDFGASRAYPDEFVDPYVNILIAASKNDKTAIRDLSIKLGYLTGAESSTMVDAHVQSVLTLAEPFSSNGPEVYDFRDQTITDRVRSLIPVMVNERLAPPPEETYSLHRKLSGAFLLCARLGSRVPCRELFENAIEVYRKGGKIK